MTDSLVQCKQFQIVFTAWSAVTKQEIHVRRVFNGEPHRLIKSGADIFLTKFGCGTQWLAATVLQVTWVDDNTVFINVAPRLCGAHDYLVLEQAEIDYLSNAGWLFEESSSQKLTKGKPKP